ncbi:ATP-binding protein [Candidatus Saccharibacteria bacterium]|nr:ATP-binding protein [Candidatus Saccharibacteria bacterium]
MYREKMAKLIEWKNKESRKPLILDGPRQVGKTWLLKKFGAEHYQSVAYINMENNPTMVELFAQDYDVRRIIKGLSIYLEQEIIPGETLIILDEIQEVPKALTALKYFNENAHEYHIAVAGSLLGISLHENASFPVGKVETIKLHPLSFAEFLRATGKESLAEAVSAGDIETLRPFHEALVEELKYYMVVGGMPEVVMDYLENGNLLNTRNIQGQILGDYERDFSKHAPLNEVPKIREVYNILPKELAKENKKFLFSMIKSGARAKEYENAMLWLEDAGIARRVKRVETVKVPLSIYADNDAFKFYASDVGLLGAKAGLNPAVLLEGDELFLEFKGAMAEQFVLQELVAAGYVPYYYHKDKPAREVDFLLDFGHTILPIEVKSGEKTYSASLGSYIREYSPEVAVKLSMNPYREHQTGTVDYVPLYLAGQVGDLYTQKVD